MYKLPELKVFGIKPSMILISDYLRNPNTDIFNILMKYAGVCSEWEIRVAVWKSMNCIIIGFL